MTRVFDLISGGIPAGAVLLIAAIIFSNLALRFFKNSGLFSTNNIFKKTLLLNSSIIIIYMLLWVYNRPDPLPQRIIVLPTVQDSTVNLDAESFLLADIFKKNGYALEGRYLVHGWDWLFETLTEEKHSSYKEWLALSRKLNPYILIQSTRMADNTIKIQASQRDKNIADVEQLLSEKTFAADIEKLFEKLNLKLKKRAVLIIPGLKYLDADLKIANGRMDMVLQELQNDSSRAAAIARGKAFVYKGFLFKYNLEKMEFVKIVNPDFEKAKAILYPIIRSKYDSPEITYLLGRMAVREQDYESAEVFFKKTFSEELWNARIFYYMSFMLSERLEEIGYNRRSVLEKAVVLDPGYTPAVLDLANEAYLAGTGVVEGYGTQYALKLLETYLILNPDDPDVLTLLATFYIKIEKYDLARGIYKNLIEKYPAESNFVYDLGIVEYISKNYPLALDLFKQAIAMDNNLDAYLYAGITLEMMGDKMGALKYYRDRVRYKTADDDTYAREAMRAIRNILEDQQTAQKDSLN